MALVAIILYSVVPGEGVHVGAINFRRLNNFEVTRKMREGVTRVI